MISSSYFDNPIGNQPIFNIHFLHHLILFFLFFCFLYIFDSIRLHIIYNQSIRWQNEYYANRYRLTFIFNQIRQLF